MRRATFKQAILAVAIFSSTARAFDSKCYVTDQNGKPIPCADGPETAASRWIGASDEHRQLWQKTATLLGLPNPLLGDVSIDVYTSSDPVLTKSGSFPSLRPVAFDKATRVRTRAWQIGELSQLPDFSYSLWDWASGNDSCPLDGLAMTDPGECHAFATHMGPVNSNHFLPQAAVFYERIHEQALARAHDCQKMATALEPAAGRLDDYPKACEIEALSIEAFAQHFLQDAWSEGHMWQRWGSPDIKDFQPLPPNNFINPISAAESRRYRAMVVAGVSGLIHGAKGLLQDKFAAIGWTCNDAMCAPGDGIEFVDPMGVKHQGLGDLYVGTLLGADPQSPFWPQAAQFYSCATSGMSEVYLASGRQHGPLVNPMLMGLQSVDPESGDCFGQRVTNRAINQGMGIDFYIPNASQWQLSKDFADFVHATVVPDGNGAQWHVPLTILASRMIPDQLQVNNNPVVDNLQWDLVHSIVFGDLAARAAPDGTTLAEGALGPLLDMTKNGDYVSNNPVAAYVDPALPWPDTKDGVTPDAATRAQALAGTFHRAHAADWCNDVTPAMLSNLQKHVQSAADATELGAACDVCAEIAVRHLRLGTSAMDYDKSQEPLCTYLASPGPPSYSYYRPPFAMDALSAARAFCGCSESLVLTDKGVARVSFQQGKIAQLSVAGQANGFVAAGASPRAMALAADGGGDPIALVTNAGEATVSVLSLVPGQEREIDTDNNPMTSSMGAPKGITRIDVGQEPRGIAVTPDGKRALVAMAGSNQVAVVDIPGYSTCRRFNVGLDKTMTVPDSVVILPNGKKAYVSLTGTAQSPGTAVAVLDVAAATDCQHFGGEVTAYITGLGNGPRPAALAVSFDGTKLAIADRGNNLIWIADTANDLPINFLKGAKTPSALAWSIGGARVFWSEIGGPVGTPLETFGAAQYGELANFGDIYAVGVVGSGRAVALSTDETWVYVGDDKGNLTALSLDLWDGAQAHWRVMDGHSGGCIDMNTGWSIPCAPTLQLGSVVKQILEY